MSVRILLVWPFVATEPKMTGCSEVKMTIRFHLIDVFVRMAICGTILNIHQKMISRRNVSHTTYYCTVNIVSSILLESKQVLHS